MTALVYVRSVPRIEFNLNPQEVVSILNPNRTLNEEKFPDYLKIKQLGDIKNLVNVDEIEKYPDIDIYIFEPDVRCTSFLPEINELLKEYNKFSNVFVMKELSKLKENLENKEYQRIHFVDFSGMENVVKFLWNFRMGYDERYHFYLYADEIDIQPSSILKKGHKFETLYYPLFSMEVVSDDITQEEDPVKHMKILAQMLIKYLRLGFHLEKIYDNKKIGWEMDLGIPEMDLFLREFDLYPPIEDHRITYKEQFYCDAQYRKVVTIQLAKVLAHYMRKNKLTKKKDPAYFLTPEAYTVLIQ